jgi:DNA-binding transcriptional LysR family regulator
MRITLDALLVLDAIERTGSFAAAAKELNRVPSAVSYTVQKLEHDLGVTLFERTGHAARLTPTGTALVADGRALLAQAQAVEERMQRAALGETGALVVAHTEVAPYARLIPLVTAVFQRRWPGVRLTLRALTTPQAWDAIRDGRVDVGFVFGGPPDDGTLEVERLCDDPIVGAIVPASHPLAASDALPIAALAEAGVITFPRDMNPPLHDRIGRAFADAGAPLRVAMEVTDWRNTAQLVAAGLGAALATAAMRDIAPAETVWRPVLGLAIPFGLDVVWARRRDTPPLTQFLNVVREARRDGIERELNATASA